MLLAAPLRAQQITVESIDHFIAGKNAEKPSMQKVSAQVKELDKKIADWRKCYAELRDAGQVVGMSPSGFKAKAVTRAKCGATDPDGWVEERGRLLVDPELVGARAAGMEPGDYSHFKERVVAYLGGDRHFADAALKALNARATDLSNAMDMAIEQADNGGGSRAGGGIGGMIGNALGAQMRMFTPDMTWAYVGYLNGILYMSGATMFETDYKAGEWTKWEIKDASQSEQHMVLERAMIRRDPDKSEWWRTKTISVTPQSADTIILETQMKPMDADGLTMQVVRMRGKFPGDTAGKELMVPDNMHTLSAAAFARKPTKESIAGATIGTESIKAGNTTYTTKHVRFGSGGGDMDWWL
ncbi:MAG: hypothetical protein JWN53_319, partial [Gemmatimonadetes bacterium]|nr:hypothetical protein [Gemmatimonadota bacterium]